MVKYYRTICVQPEAMCPLSNEPIELGSSCILIEGEEEGKSVVVSPNAIGVKTYLENHKEPLEFKAPSTPLKESGVYRSTAKYTNKRNLDDSEEVMVLRVSSVDRTYDTYTVLPAKGALARGMLDLRECKFEELPDLKDHM